MNALVILFMLSYFFKCLLIDMFCWDKPNSERLLLQLKICFGMFGLSVIATPAFHMFYSVSVGAGAAVAMVCFLLYEFYNVFNEDPVIPFNQRIRNIYGFAKYMGLYAILMFTAGGVVTLLDTLIVGLLETQ